MSSKYHILFLNNFEMFFPPVAATTLPFNHSTSYLIFWGLIWNCLRDPQKIRIKVSQFSFHWCFSMTIPENHYNIGSDTYNFSCPHLQNLSDFFNKYGESQRLFRSGYYHVKCKLMYCCYVVDDKHAYF